MRAGLLTLAAIALAGFIVIAVVLPRMASSDLKVAAASLVAGADEAKSQVGAAAAKAANLTGAGANVKIDMRVDPNAGEMKYVVEPNGVIRGWNRTNAIEIVVTPVLSGGKTVWTCTGYPHDAMPTSCGGK